MAFMRNISAGYVLFCRTKENRKGRRCPEGMKAPVGLLSRRPVCEANAACSARQGRSDFDALDPTGCGTLRLLRALGGTRILQAAAPTAPPCIRHWRRSSPLQTRGCSPLIIPRQRSKRKNASRFAQRIFFRFSDLQAPQSLRDSSPQGATNANIKIIFPLIMARAHAVAISNSVTPAQTTRHILWRLHLPLQNPPPHGNRSPVRRGSSWPGPSGRRPAPAARRRRAR